jgi:hypothetical protein
MEWLSMDPPAGYASSKSGATAVNAVRARLPPAHYRSAER